MNALAPVSDTAAAIVERVVINGDLSKLSPQERVSYYNEVCKSVGLNPLTQPFSYITLNGKLALYALRACTDQLRSVYGVSVEEMSETEREGVFIVTAKVRNKEGRTDIAKGAVNIAGLKGEALANALMKAETKAKRRATLSICGLGMLDESEADSVPGAVKGEPHAAPAAALTPPSPPSAVEPPTPAAPKKTPSEWLHERINEVNAITSLNELTDFESKYTKHIALAQNKEPEMHQVLVGAIQAKQIDLF